MPCGFRGEAPTALVRGDEKVSWPRTGSQASQPGTAALLGAYHAARFALIRVNTPVPGRRVQPDQAGPSAGRRLSSQVMASPSPAIPDAPWSASRQYLPGSQQVPSLLCGWRSADVVAAAGGGGSGRRGCRGGCRWHRGGRLHGDRDFLWPCLRTRRVVRRRPAGCCRAGGGGDGGSVVGLLGVSAGAGDPPDDDDQRGQAAEHGQYLVAPRPRLPCGVASAGPIACRPTSAGLVARSGPRTIREARIPSAAARSRFPLPRGTDGRALPLQETRERADGARMSST